MNKNKYAEKFKIILLIEIALSAVFSVFTLKFSLDVAGFAGPLSIIFTLGFAYFGLLRVLKNGEEKYFFHTLKFVQYVPTIFLISFLMQRSGKNATPFFVDVIDSILWIIIFVISLVLLYYMSEKRYENLAPLWKKKFPKRQKPKGAMRVLYEIVDWIDNLLQVIFLVFIAQVFIAQLYIIPSESMVPEFLVNDRVVVEKIGSGPKFPLTDVGLPVMSKYKRGDIVVLRNPHYQHDRKAEVKSVRNQLIYMLTFMAVNLNKDENGEFMYDPLVKRIAGVQGEQLVMQDGVLYTRTKNSDVFTPIPKNEDFAAWNLNDVDMKTKRGIHYIPLSRETYEAMLDFEEERRNYDLNVAEFQCKEIVRKLKELQRKSNIELTGTFSAPSLLQESLFEYNSPREIMTQSGGIEWFEKLMTSWIPSKNNIRDIYEESNYKLNVMSKVALGNMILNNAEYMVYGVKNVSEEDDARLMLFANKLYVYVKELLDLRNMPVFPPNDSNGNATYIPKNCYFMMGDNRFNSLDLRHSYEQFEKPLTSDDPMSLTYKSMMAPQYIHQKYIVGKPIYRFWPLNRHKKIN